MWAGNTARWVRQPRKGTVLGQSSYHMYIFNICFSQAKHTFGKSVGAKFYGWLIGRQPAASCIVCHFLFRLLLLLLTTTTTTDYYLLLLLLTHRTSCYYFNLILLLLPPSSYYYYCYCYWLLLLLLLLLLLCVLPILIAYCYWRLGVSVQPGNRFVSCRACVRACARCRM